VDQVELCAVIAGCVPSAVLLGLLGVETRRLLRGSRCRPGEPERLFAIALVGAGLTLGAWPLGLPLLAAALLAPVTAVALGWGGAWGLAAADRAGIASPLRRALWTLGGLPLLPTLLVTYLGALFTALLLLMLVAGVTFAGLSGARVSGSDLRQAYHLAEVAAGCAVVTTLAGLYFFTTYWRFSRLVRGRPPHLPTVRQLLLLELLALLPPLLPFLIVILAARSLRRSRYGLAEFLVLGLLTGQGIAIVGALLPKETPTGIVLLVALGAGVAFFGGGARGLLLAHRLELTNWRWRYGLLLNGLLLGPALAGLLLSPFLLLGDTRPAWWPEALGSVGGWLAGLAAFFGGLALLLHFAQREHEAARRRRADAAPAEPPGAPEPPSDGGAR
jgi:hypothetical protein